MRTHSIILVLDSSLSSTPCSPSNRGVEAIINRFGPISAVSRSFDLFVNPVRCPLPLLSSDGFVLRILHFKLVPVP